MAHAVNSNDVLNCLKSVFFISILFSFRCSKVAFNCRFFECQFILTPRLNTVQHVTNVVARQHESSWVRLSLFRNQLLTQRNPFLNVFCLFFNHQVRLASEAAVGGAKYVLLLLTAVFQEQSMDVFPFISEFDLRCHINYLMLFQMKVHFVSWHLLELFCCLFVCFLFFLFISTPTDVMGSYFIFLSSTELVTAFCSFLGRYRVGAFIGGNRSQLGCVRAFFFA